MRRQQCRDEHRSGGRRHIGNRRGQGEGGTPVEQPGELGRRFPVRFPPQVVRDDQPGHQRGQPEQHDQGEPESAEGVAHLPDRARGRAIAAVPNVEQRLNAAVATRARSETDRPHALRRAIMSCRSGGVVSVMALPRPPCPAGPPTGTELVVEGGSVRADQRRARNGAYDRAATSAGGRLAWTGATASRGPGSAARLWIT
jgi:hypothetical protein